jgi:murein DD-endopeptidase MepM/ murein hydrolase activator NlpD
MALLLVMTFVLASWNPRQALAQAGETAVPAPGPRRHVVQAGDNLTFIADQYGVTVAELKLVNHLRDDDVLGIGRELLVPGGEVLPLLTVYTARPGDSLARIARGFGEPLDAILSTNRTLNRDYLPAVGQPVAVESLDGATEMEVRTGRPYIVSEGETLLDVAVRTNVPASHLIYVNELSFPVRLFPGQRLRIPSEDIYFDLPGDWVEVTVKPETIAQGDTVSVYVENLLDGRPSGELAGLPLRFAAHDEGWVALTGIDAFTEPGRYALKLGGSGERPWYPYEQEVAVVSSGFPNQAITVPEDQSALLDPQIRSDEDAFLATLYGQFTEEQQWDGLFQTPVTTTVVTAPYGGGRSYNDGPVSIFHSGTDFDGAIGTPILAAANGTVVFNDVLTLRGNTVILDHGLGVFSGYYHLSESFVEVGEQVMAGQAVGAGGSTGLSTGPHLHWELQVNGVPVNGMQWTEQLFP